jgi:hypothetical protein
MYGSNVGSVSGIVHVFARRPVLAATVVLAAVVVANVPKTPPPPPVPPPPAVVTLMAEPEPPAYGGSHKDTTYTCEFGTNKAPTNLCKATLDSIATFLNNDTAATVKVTGSLNNVLAVRKYFTTGESKFGIAASRIRVNIETDEDPDFPKGSNSVTIEQIP